MRYIKKITVTLVCLAFIGCGGSDEDSTSTTNNTEQVTVESSATAMELDKVYEMKEGSSITEDKDAILEVKTDLLTGITTAKLTSGSASISYN